MTYAPPPPGQEPMKIRVCTACGKVEGEHRGWDVSCHIHAVEVEEEQVERGPDTRVTAIRESTKP